MPQPAIRSCGRGWTRDECTERWCTSVAPSSHLISCVCVFVLVDDAVDDEEEIGHRGVDGDHV